MYDSTYQLPSATIPVYGEFDVVVAGGGPSGCAAAVTAARKGVKVLLLEKDGYLGGATVSQNVLVILSTNAVDFQGIWHEYMTELIRLRGVYEDEFVHDPAHFSGCVDPEMVKYAWDALLARAGVKILHHAAVIDVIKEGRTVRGVITATKSGHQAIWAQRVIDCTGDGIVCHYAGAAWEAGANGKPWAMALTKGIRLGNIAPGSGPQNACQLAAIRQNLLAAIERGEYHTPVMTSGRGANYIGLRRLTWQLPRHRNEIFLVTSRILECDPLDPDDITRAEREGREQAFEVADFYRRYVPGCEKSYLADSGAQVGVRSSRRIKGIATVTQQDTENFTHYEDGIARSSWDIDIWPADSISAPAVPRDTAAHHERLCKMQHGASFDIRYGCLVVSGLENLLMGGRIISAEHAPESSLRIQQTCMATGEAAGMAAALSIRKNTSPHELDPMLVVEALAVSRATVKPAFRLIEEAMARFARQESIEDLV